MDKIITVNVDYFGFYILISAVTLERIFTVRKL